MSSSIADHVLFALIAILYPLITILDWHFRLRPALSNDGPQARRRAYRQTILEQMLLTTIVLVSWFLESRSAQAIGLGVPEGVAFWIALIITIAAAFLMWQQITAVRNVASAREQVLRQFQGSAVLIAPRGRDELWNWTIMSSTVGICEEILYRGFLLWYLLRWLSEAPAILVAAIIFGLAHLYQGWGGVIRSGILGAVFCLGYLLIGSLWALMALHAVVDIGTGFTLSAAIKDSNMSRPNAQ